MGLFSFLKRKGKKEEPAGFEAPGIADENSLELPPPPPLMAHDIYSELPELPGPQRMGGFKTDAWDLKNLKPAAMPVPPKKPEAYKITPIEREYPAPIEQPGQLEAPKPIEVPRQMPESDEGKLPELMMLGTKPTGKPFALHRPAFIRAHDFRALVEGLNAAARIAKPGKGLPGSINELRTRENEKLDKWHQTLEDLQRNLVIIDQEIFER